MKKIYLALVLVLMMVSVGWATTIYVSGSGGNHPAGSDSNDGLSWETAKLTVQAAINALTGNGNDTIILDDESFVVTSTIDTSTTSKTGGSIIIQSESQDPSICAIDGNNSNIQLFISNASVPTDIIGITFKNVTYTVGYPIIKIMTDADFTFKNVIFDNLNINTTSGGIYPIINLGNNNSTAYLLGVTIKNCSYNATSCQRGMFLGCTDNTVDVNICGLMVQNCSGSGFGAGACSGGVYFQGNGTINDLVISNITVTGDTYPLYGCLRLSGSTNLLLGTIRLSNISYSTSSGACEGIAAYIDGASTEITGTLEVANCSGSTTSGNGIGVFVVYGEGHHLTITGESYFHDNDVLTDWQATNDGILAAAQGADLDVRNAIFYNNKAVSGAGVRFGGWCNGTIKYCLFYNNQTDSTSGKGGAIYLMLHSSSLENVIQTVDNCIIVNNSAPSGAGIYVEKSDVSGYEETVYIRNSVLWNDNGNEIGCTNNPVGIISHCVIQGGLSSVCANMQDTITSILTSDPLLTSTYHLTHNSPCIDAGTKVTSIHDQDDWKDLDGHVIHYGSNPDIGCYEYNTNFIKRWGKAKWNIGKWGRGKWGGARW